MVRTVLIVIVVSACATAVPDPATCARRTLFVTFEGGTLQPGERDDAATNITINVRVPRTLPGYRASDPGRATQIQSVFDQVQSALAPFPVDVVRERPA